LSIEDARWRPADGSWSVLEILRHLGDEEVDDFRARLDRTLRDPQEDWTPIDPEGWAVQRRYNEADFHEAIERFVSERRTSIAWLRGLGAPAWEHEHRHARLGSMRAGDLLASWAAHDTLHLRQIAKRLFQLARRDAGEYATRYAGEWSG
ncbi:MAG: DinB family protein, partial [Planctomycetota bacterium]